MVSLNVLILFGCIHIVKKDRTISEIEKQILKDSNGGEDFNSFFQYFRQDTVFQQNRISLPFSRYSSTYYSATESRDTVTTIDKEEYWRHCSFMMNKHITFPIQQITVRQDTSTILFEESDSPYDKRIKGTFWKINGKWFIKSLQGS